MRVGRVINILGIAFSSAMALQAFIAVGHANLLVNGSFETPVIAPASFFDFGVGGEPAGFAWTVRA